MSVRRSGLVRNAVRRADYTIISQSAAGVIWIRVSCAILEAEPPRSNCPDHGVKTVKLPWAEPGSRFTAMFEHLAIDWLLAASQKAVAERLHLSWDEVHAIQERAVKCGLERRKAEPVEHIGVDEKSFTRGHHYFTLVNDPRPGSRAVRG